MKANFKILTACLVISCMFIAGAYAADNPADTAKSPKPPANITEKLVMDWPKDGKWDGGMVYSGKSTTRLGITTLSPRATSNSKVRSSCWKSGRRQKASRGAPASWCKKFSWIS